MGASPAPEGSRAWLTVKGAPTRQDSGYFVRPELEAEIPADEAARLARGFRLSECPWPPVRDLLARSGDLDVRPFLRLCELPHACPSSTAGPSSSTGR